MKKTFKVLGLVLFSVVLLAACKKSTNPVDVDIFVGQYTGSTAYSGPDKNIASADGTVTVVKVGNKYRFSFDRNIPDFGEDFEKKDDNSFVSIGSKGFTGITINEKKLKILVIKEDATWTADCTRK